jgi:hypothetical protein
MKFNRIEFKKLLPFGLTASLVGTGVVFDADWCKLECEHVLDQPHAPHESHIPIPTRPLFQNISSTSASPFVPSFALDVMADDIDVLKAFRVK